MSSLLASAGPSVLDRAGDVLTGACEQRLWAQADTEIVERVQAALRVRAQADAVLLAAIGEVDARALARTRGSTSTRAWLHGAHQLDPAEAAMLVRTAKTLREGFEETGTALAAGEVSLTQARVVIRSVTDLPADLHPGMAAAAETLMIGHCAVFDPTTLALIGHRLAECIDPEGTQARDEKKLLEREKTAHDKRGLTISPDKDGAGRYIHGYLDTLGGAIITAALDGLSAPIPGHRRRRARPAQPRPTPPRRPDRTRPPPVAVRSTARRRRREAAHHHHHPGAVPARQDRGREAQRRLPVVPQPGRLPGLRRRDHPLPPRRVRCSHRPGPGPKAVHRPRPHRPEHP